MDPRGPPAAWRDQGDDDDQHLRSSRHQGAESGSYLRLVDQLLQEARVYETIATALGVTLPAVSTQPPAGCRPRRDPREREHGGAGECCRRDGIGQGVPHARSPPRRSMRARPPGDPSLDPHRWGSPPRSWRRFPPACCGSAYPAPRSGTAEPAADRFDRLRGRAPRVARKADLAPRVRCSIAAR